MCLNPIFFQFLDKGISSKFSTTICSNCFDNILLFFLVMNLFNICLIVLKKLGSLTLLFQKIHCSKLSKIINEKHEVGTASNRLHFHWSTEIRVDELKWCSCSLNCRFERKSGHLSFKTRLTALLIAIGLKYW